MVFYSFYEDWMLVTVNEKQKKFELSITDLVKKVDRREVEFREVVYDPLKAAPQISLGHLNSVG